jgi:hypothetical protein
LKKAKKVAKYRKVTESLPKYIRSNLENIQFGISTHPSDDMNMVMNNEFGLDFIYKMKQRQAIEKELEYIANM